MIRKIGKMIVTATLLTGLAACGAGQDTAYDQNGPVNVRQDGGMNDRFQAVQHDFNARTIGMEPIGRRNLNKDWNRNNSQERSNLGQNPNISADYTQLSSGDFPHTKAIVIHDAKYSFTAVNQQQVEEIQKKIEQKLKEQYGKLTPELRQKAITQAQQQIQKLQAAQGKDQQTQQKKAQTNQQAEAQQPDGQQQPKKQQTEQQAKQPAAQQPQAQQPAQKPAPQQPAQKPAEQPAQPAQTGDLDQMAAQVIQLTNAERVRAGLPALQADTQLSSVAKKKSQDMQANNYFSHTSPTYGSPFDMMRDFGVTYRTAGENIAQGQRTPQEVVQAWMNSEGHRKNILSSEFTHIGVGYEATGHHWTQMFIGK